MSEKTVYIGETDAKRVARLQLYLRIQQLQSEEVRKRGMVVVLAGPEAGEVGCLRYLLNLDPRQVLFVDTDKNGLRVARSRWPGVATFNGDLLDAIQALKAPLAFANLDFTGVMKKKERRIVEEAALCTMKGGFISYTYFTGREMPGRSNFNEIVKVPAIREALPSHFKKNRLVMDEKRTVWYMSELMRLLGPTFDPAFFLRYDARHEAKYSRHSPMGVMAFQNAPHSIRTRTWETLMKSGTHEGSTNGKLDTATVKGRLRSKAIALAFKGKTSKEIAEILNVKAGTVAAWLANETRGTYGKIYRKAGDKK